MHPDDGHVVSNFMDLALKGDDLAIYGRGKQSRSFCYLDDLSDGIDKLMNSSREITGPMNLGNPIELSIVELAEQVFDLMNSKSKLVLYPLPSKDPRQKKPDISLPSKTINWTPTVDLNIERSATIKYFESEIGHD
jgi:UDP-glucuronate decarboxylase